MLHRHHIIPVHAGGSNDESNITKLTISEHAEAHMILWIENGQHEDFVAWKTLSGQIGTEELTLHRNRLAHQKKLASGFYDRLGALNSKRLKGVSNPDFGPRMKKWFAENEILWWNDGTKDTRSATDPGPAWKLGRLNEYITDDYRERQRKHMASTRWWNNGITNTRKAESPGEEWKLGRIKV